MYLLAASSILILSCLLTFSTTRHLNLCIYSHSGKGVGKVNADLHAELASAGSTKLDYWNTRLSQRAGENTAARHDYTCEEKHSDYHCASKMILLTWGKHR